MFAQYAVSLVKKRWSWITKLRAIQTAALLSFQTTVGSSRVLAWAERTKGSWLKSWQLCNRSRVLAKLIRLLLYIVWAMALTFWNQPMPKTDHWFRVSAVINWFHLQTSNDWFVEWLPLSATLICSYDEEWVWFLLVQRAFKMAICVSSQPSFVWFDKYLQLLYQRFYAVAKKDVLARFYWTLFDAVA